MNNLKTNTRKRTVSDIPGQQESASAEHENRFSLPTGNL